MLTAFLPFLLSFNNLCIIYLMLETMTGYHFTATGRTLFHSSWSIMYITFVLIPDLIFHMRIVKSYTTVFVSTEQRVAAKEYPSFLGQ